MKKILFKTMSMKLYKKYTKDKSSNACIDYLFVMKLEKENETNISKMNTTL